MKSDARFDDIVESIYNLPLEYKEELNDLLKHNISEVRRDEISKNFKNTQKEHKSNKLKFASSVKDLKKLM